MSREDQIRFRQLLVAGLAAGDSVSDAYLDYLDPAMRHYFRDYYMKGQHLYQTGMLAGDLRRQVESDGLIAAWYEEFWRARGPVITEKAFPE